MLLCLILHLCCYEVRSKEELTWGCPRKGGEGKERKAGNSIQRMDWPDERRKAEGKDEQLRDTQLFERVAKA